MSEKNKNNEFEKTTNQAVEENNEVNDNKETLENKYKGEDEKETL